MTIRYFVKEIFEQLVQNELTVVKDIDLVPITYEKGKVSCVSLFCGCGGLDLGVELAGIEANIGQKVDITNWSTYSLLREQSLFQTVYALDFFSEALETYHQHFPKTTIQNANIRKLKEFPYADCYFFGFPCPGFSAAGPRDMKDERNYLYVHCCRALQQARPLFFVAENVPGMLTLQKGEVFEQIKKDFKACGYNVYVQVVNARDYGVAQIRERVIIVGVREDLSFKYEFPKPIYGNGKDQKPFITLKDCIWDLQYESGDYYKGSYSSQYISRNRKKNWDEQSFTIQASARQAPMHPGGKSMIKLDGEHWAFAEPEKERRLSVREAARIQSFPDWFSFSTGSKNVSHNTKVDKAFKQIGNAVPPLLAREIMRPIAEFLKNESNGF